MKGKHKQGSFCSRYVRKGMNYSRACEMVQTKMVENHERKKGKGFTQDTDTGSSRDRDKSRSIPPHSTKVR